MGLQRLVLPIAREHPETAIVMMSVPLDVLDPEKRHHRQVLLENDRSERAQIFAGQHAQPSLPPPRSQETGIGETLDDTLAVLVAGSRVADLEGTRDVAKRAVGFVDDQRR